MEDTGSTPATRSRSGELGQNLPLVQENLIKLPLIDDYSIQRLLICLDALLICEDFPLIGEDHLLIRNGRVACHDFLQCWFEPVRTQRLTSVPRRRAATTGMSPRCERSSTAACTGTARMRMPRWSIAHCTALGSSTSPRAEGGTRRHASSIDGVK